MISEVYAMAPAPQGAAGAPPNNMLVTFFPMVVVFLIFYFLMIRPQRKKDEDHKKYLSGLQRDDAVILHSGILAKVVSVEDNGELTLDIGSGTKIRALKSAVAGPQTQPQAPKKA